MTEYEGLNSNSQKSNSVADKVIQSFINKLKMESDYGVIAERLEPVIFSDKINEQQIRNSLFEENTND